MYILVNPAIKPLIPLCSVPNEAYYSNWTWTAWTKLCQLDWLNFSNPYPDIQCTKTNPSRGVPQCSCKTRPKRPQQRGERFQEWHGENERKKRSLGAQWEWAEQFQSRACSGAGALKLDFVFSWNWFSYIKVSTASNECPCKTLSMEKAWDHLTLGWGWSPGKSVPVKGVIWFAAKFPSPRSQELHSEIKIKRAVSTLLQAAYQQRGDIPETHYIQYTWEMWK